MSENAVTLKLYGRLADTYGAEHVLYVNNPAEAVRLMAANYQAFPRDLAEEDVFMVVDGSPRPENQILLGAQHTIALVPVDQGAKEGWQTALAIAGGALLLATGVGALASFGASAEAGWGIATVSTLGSAASALTNFAIGYALTAAVAYVTRADDVDEPDAAKQKLGSTFGGAINTTQTGLPVQVGYGRLRIGSFVLTTSITPADRPDLLAQGL